MKRMNKLFLSLGFLFVLSSLFVTLCPDHTVAQPLYCWSVTATNNTGQTAYDFHAVFTGTGGTIGNAEMVENGAGAGEAHITGSGNTIDITWDEPGLPNGATFKFEFSTEHPGPVDFSDGYFTDKQGNNIGAATATVEQVECEKLPTLSEWVLIILALSVGGFFVWQLRRRRKAVVSLR